MVYLYRTDIAPERPGLTLARVNQSLKIFKKIKKKLSVYCTLMNNTVNVKVSICSNKEKHVR